jgi:uncharacterized protein (TIGR02270 family)
MFESIVERHAEIAAHLWDRRDAAVGAFHHRLATLADLEERLDAHLDGLRVAEELGWEVALAAFDAEPSAGALFVASAVALDRGDLQATARLFEHAGDAALRRGLIAALACEPHERVAAIVSGLHGARRPELRTIGLGVMVAERRDPGAVLARALDDADRELRARALRSVGRLGRHDLMPRLHGELVATHDDSRFAAAWSLALGGERSALAVLEAFALGGGVHAEAAADLVARRLTPAETGAWLARLAGAGHARLAVMAAAATGDAVHVPWLFEQMLEPKLARIAGESFVTITGIDVPRDFAGPAGFASGPTDDPADDDVAMDPDAHLHWPDRAALLQLWQRESPRFARGERFLCGARIAEKSLMNTLRTARQRHRAAAAVELALLRPSEPLFEVRATAARQRQSLGITR